MSRLTIGLSLSPTWLRDEWWRRADSRAEELFTSGFFITAARWAEAACLDFVFKPDALFLDPEPLRSGPGFSSLDPVVLMTAVAGATTRIGLVPTVSASFAHPYTAARQLQSLDRISAGRVGWNVVTSLGGAENFGDAAPDDPYRDAADLVATVEGLRQTFPAVALRVDREEGVFADPDALSRLAPTGRYRSAGPLTVPAVSERRLPLLHAGGSPASHDFAARYADAVFAMTESAEDGMRLRRRLRELSREHGRAHPVRVLPGVSLCLAESRAAARALAAAAGTRTRQAHVRHWSIVGTPEDAAEQIAARFAGGAIDGVIALPAGSWRSLELFTSRVVPLLANAGVFRAEYRGATLADHLSETLS